MMHDKQYDQKEQGWNHAEGAKKIKYSGIFSPLFQK